MPVATARKVEALRHDFRSAAQLADILVGDPAPELVPFRVDRPTLIPSGD